MPKPLKPKEEIDRDTDESFGTDEHQITTEEAKSYGVIIPKEDFSD